MDQPTIDRAQLQALRTLRRVLGDDNVTVIGIRGEPPGTTGPPRNPPPHNGR
ncbi:MAG TPA: hypothetical protein VFA46_13545 [Actinomycetes bacterium]|jgi:hypothetical protein|nr:hypothetical protein [Actinomycetes bacterium]